MEAALALNIGTEFRQIVTSHFRGFTWESTSVVCRTEGRERPKTDREAMSKRKIPVPAVNPNSDVYLVTELSRPHQ
jgi:hypothetical protein